MKIVFILRMIVHLQQLLYLNTMYAHPQNIMKISISLRTVFELRIQIIGVLNCGALFRHVLCIYQKLECFKNIPVLDLLWSLERIAQYHLATGM